MNLNVSMIVVDGGPCAGKTTGIVHMSEAIIAEGMIPLIVPEAATLLICGGISPFAIPGIPFQKAVAALQLANEEIWYQNAIDLSRNTGRRVVVLCDRGIASGIAYIEDPHPFELFEIFVVGNAKFPSLESMLSRYTGVIHFVSAADGAEEYYTTENNSARHESVELARAMDEKSKSIWLAHPHLCEIPNRTPSGEPISFDQKIKNAVKELFHMLGVPIPVEIEDKYVLNSFDPKKLPVPYEVVKIKQTYLEPEEKGASTRVRKRTWRDGVSYIHTTKKDNPNGGRYEVERFMTHHEYISALERVDESRRPLIKTRYCFLWKAQRFEVDVFDNANGLILMEREKTTLTEETIVPPFIDVAFDTKGDPKYSNSEIAVI